MENMDKTHPSYPQSNIHKYSGYQPEMYGIGSVPATVRTDESLTPERPPCLTQRTVGMYLQPLTRELNEVPLRRFFENPTIDDLPQAVIDNMLMKDKAFLVDKPEANAYTLHDAYYNFGIIAEKIKSPHQDVFPRSYQYDLDCVKHRRHHACDGLRQEGKSIDPQCRDCNKSENVSLTPSYAVEKRDAEKERWRNYPDLNTLLPPTKIRELMDEVGKPFKNEACNWYYNKYPPQKFDCILRKFSK